MIETIPGERWLDNERVRYKHSDRSKFEIKCARCAKWKIWDDMIDVILCLDCSDEIYFKDARGLPI